MIALRLPLVLASKSPRRSALLGAAELAHLVLPPEDIEEYHDASMTPAELTVMNARAKARRIAELQPAALVLGADTLVYLDGEPLGKPATLDEAMTMLRRLSGRTHQVCTGVHLCARIEAQQVEFHELTDVKFKPLSEETIRNYLSVIDPLDKAGAYAAQEHSDMVIERIDGSWTNVVGLPMEKTLRELQRWMKT
ncbi:MAG: Maf family protein [Verrucomicrobiales bacterium]